MTKRSEWVMILKKCLEDFVRDFSKNGEQAKENCTMKIKQITETAMESAKKSAGHINNSISSILVGLNAIENPTEMEVACLLENFAGMYYYVDKKLAAMASKAGLKAHYRPEIGENLKLIRQIETIAISFVTKYTEKQNVDDVFQKILQISEKL